MVLFYNQGDQDIYEGGQFYIPQEQYRLGKFNNTVAPMPMDNTQQVTQEFGIPYTGAFTNAGGGGGGGLGGRFGNLDLGNTKTFQKRVYNPTGPATGWKMQDITGYYDPTSNTYKTLEGKNIEHGGLFTGDPKQGDIEGEDFKFPGITGVVAQWLKNKAIAAKDKIGDTFSGGQASQADIDAANLGAAEEIGATGPQWHTSKGGQDQPGAGGQNVKSSSGDVYGGAAAGYNEAAEKSDYYADGGRIGYRWGRDVNDPVVEELPLIETDDFEDIKKELNVGPMVEDVVDEDTKTMILDMHGRGMDMETISTITQTPVEVITSIISALTQQAQGGRIPFFYGGLASIL